MFHLLQSEAYYFRNWYLDIDFNLEICAVIVFLEDWTRADFFKAVQSKLIP